MHATVASIHGRSRRKISTGPPSFHFVVRGNRKARRSTATPTPRAPTKDEMKALDRALPEATYWREVVERNGQPYPPPGCRPKCLTCQTLGDRGRLYPGTYFAGSRSGRRCCQDCLNHWILEQRIRLMRWESSGGITDGRAETQEQLDAEGTVFAPEDSSASAAVLAAMENAGVEVEECPLPSEREEDLRAYIARGVPSID